MRAGSLRNKVTIQRNGPTRGTYGEEVIAWSTLKTVWASIKPVSGVERTQGGQVDSIVTHLITMRYTDITPADRIIKGSRAFNINRVLNKDEKNKQLDIEAIEDV